MNVGPLAKGKDMTVLRSKDGSRQKRRDYKKNLRKAIGEYLERREFGISDGYTTSPHFVQEWTGFRDLVYSPSLYLLAPVTHNDDNVVSKYRFCDVASIHGLTQVETRKLYILPYVPFSNRQ
jgi:hypothetical protein